MRMMTPTVRPWYGRRRSGIVTHPIDPDIQAIIDEFGSTEPFPEYEDILDVIVNQDTPNAMDVM